MTRLARAHSRTMLEQVAEEKIDGVWVDASGQNILGSASWIYPGILNPDVSEGSEVQEPRYA